MTIGKRIWISGVSQGIPLFFLALFCAPDLRAATLDGKVNDPAGQPVARAEVTLIPSLGFTRKRQTDEQGGFRFENLRKGRYTLLANIPSFATARAEVSLDTTESKQVELQLVLSAVREEVVVSASHIETTSLQSGSALTLISRNEIEERGALAVQDVLHAVPGVAANQTGRRGGVTGVFIRGGESDFNLVLIDGIPMNQFGGAFDYGALPSDPVERVEVIRGPQSALYGSNAVGGVVNVLTRRPQAPTRFTGRAEGGSFTTRRLATGASGLWDRLGWAYDLSRLDTGGLVENDNYRNQNASLDLSYHSGTTRRMNFHFVGNAYHLGRPGAYGSDPNGTFPGPDTTSRDKNNFFGYRVGYEEEFSHRFRQVANASFADNDFFFVSGFGDFFLKNFRAVVNTHSEWALASSDFLVFGFEYSREQTRSTFIADTSLVPFLLPRASYAPFIENRWIFRNRLFFNAGARIDHFRTRSLPERSAGFPAIAESILTQVNPRLSSAYLLRKGAPASGFGGTRLHASFGTGIRLADSFELTFTDNAQLKPERTASFDVGVEQRLAKDRLMLDATYFFNRFDDLIVSSGSFPHLSSFQTDNIANSRAQGLEVSFHLRPSGTLRVQGNYTFLDSEILDLERADFAPFPFAAGQPLLRRPRHSGSTLITWRRGRWMLTTGSYLRGSVLDVEPNLGTFACVLGLECLFANQGYVRLDGGFSYALPGGMEIYGRLHNFLNQKYEESFGFPALPLNFLAGVKFTFSKE